MYTIGDFLIRIKNAYLRGGKELSAPYAKALVAIGKILEEARYVKKVSVSGEGAQKKVIVELSYIRRKPAMRGLRIVSKPSIHVYMKKSKLNPARGGITIVSTNKGIVSAQKARKQGSGGEIICEIY